MQPSQSVTVRITASDAAHRSQRTFLRPLVQGTNQTNRLKPTRASDNNAVTSALGPNSNGPGFCTGKSPDLAAVVTVTFVVADELPVGVMEVGETLQLASDGAPVQVNATAESNPPIDDTLNTKVAVWPAVTVADDGVAAMLKSAPSPTRAMVSGLPPPLSLMVMAPCLVPATVGLKVMFIVQVPAAATEDPQSLVSAKSPLAVIPVILSVASPPLVSVTG